MEIKRAVFGSICGYDHRTKFKEPVLPCSSLRRPADAPIPRTTTRLRGTSRCAHVVTVVAVIMLIDACVSYPTIPVTGRLANAPVSTTVDSELAKHYLTRSPRHIAEGAVLAEQTADIERRFGGRPVDFKGNFSRNFAGLCDHIFYQSLFVRSYQ